MMSEHRIAASPLCCEILKVSRDQFATFEAPVLRLFFEAFTSGEYEYNRGRVTIGMWLEDFEKSFSSDGIVLLAMASHSPTEQGRPIGGLVSMDPQLDPLIRTTNIPQLYPLMQSALIAAVAVSPDFRNRGVATALLQSSLEAFRASEIRYCLLRTNDSSKNMLAFYRRLDFLELDITAYCPKGVVLKRYLCRELSAR